ncbi:hypothetical protein [Phytopseudomonas flavescens]|uniref:hypothetical protein n=1 Tax=Phytopseudomonas flavescens TaxID=29435 RepID=UPI00111355DE|nr:hypothetical protein [Pseudomonas flavescens]
MGGQIKPDPVEDYRNIQREVKEWERYLNDSVGYFAFTFAIASLGTNAPQFWATVSMIFIFAGHQVNQKGKMETLKRIIALRKQSGNEYYAFVEKDARRTISILRSLPFFIGYMTLATIIFAPSLMPTEWVTLLYGGKPYFDFSKLSIVMAQ